jgi:hypothetical protein
MTLNTWHYQISSQMLFMMDFWWFVTKFDHHVLRGFYVIFWLYGGVSLMMSGRCQHFSQLISLLYMGSFLASMAVTATINYIGCPRFMFLEVWRHILWLVGTNNNQIHCNKCVSFLYKKLHYQLVYVKIVLKNLDPYINWYILL